MPGRPCMQLLGSAPSPSSSLTIEARHDRAAATSAERNATIPNMLDRATTFARDLSRSRPWYRFQPRPQARRRDRSPQTREPRAVERDERGAEPLSRRTYSPRAATSLRERDGCSAGQYSIRVRMLRMVRVHRWCSGWTALIVSVNPEPPGRPVTVPRCSSEAADRHTGRALPSSPRAHTGRLIAATNTRPPIGVARERRASRCYVRMWLSADREFPARCSCTMIVVELVRMYESRPARHNLRAVTTAALGIPSQDRAGSPPTR